MRVGNIEGTPEEIKDMFDDQGFRWKDYLGEPYSEVKGKWVIIPIVLTIIFLASIILLGNCDIKIVSILFVLCFASGIWSTCAIHYRFKNYGVTVIVAVGIIFLMLIIFGYIKPQDTIPLIKQIIK